MTKEYEIRDAGGHRVLSFGGNDYETHYSVEIIERLIERKGIERTPAYFAHKEERQFYFDPLFRYMEKEGRRDVVVLEVGCSSGHITELLNEQPWIKEVYAFDVDKAFVDIVRLKRDEMRLDKIKRIDHFTGDQARRLPYPDDFFDVVLVPAIVEHLPFENRHEFVDEYYRKLKVGDLIAFFETPNRHYPIETHSIGLPFIHRMNPQTAYIYARLFGKTPKSTSFAEFVRAGTGWRNASYYECLPRTLMMDVEDVSEETGYGYPFMMERLRKRGGRGRLFRLVRRISKLIGFPTDFYLPGLNLVFKKMRDYER